MRRELQRPRRQWRKRRRPLLRAAIELANAANGVRPFGRDGYSPSRRSCSAGQPPRWRRSYLAGSVLDAVWRWLRGDLRQSWWPNRPAAQGITWGLLGLIMYRNVQVGAVFRDTARRDARRRLRGDRRTVTARRRRRRDLIGVPPHELIRRRYVEKADTVRYGPHPRVNFADIWRRRDLPRDGKAPVLLQVPGGAWAIGMRRPQAYPLLSHLAERGWVCVSIDYRVSPRHTWPDHIVDVKRALAWIKENIAEYGGDPDFVAITGGSAGGHLCALAALTPDDPQYQPGFEDADTSVVAAVPIYGRYDWFSTRGPGRWEFIAGSLQRFVVKKRFDEAPAGVPRRVADHPGAPRRAAVLRAARRGRLDDSRCLRRANSSRRCVTKSKDDRRLRRDSARPARIRLLRVAARRTTPPRRSRSSCPGCTPPVTRTSYCAIAFSTTVSSSESPAARRISTNASIIASVSSCGSSSGGAVGQHRDVELVDVAPHGDVQTAAGGQRADRVDLGHQRAADPAGLPRTWHVGDRQVEHLVLAVLLGEPVGTAARRARAGSTPTTG